MDKIRARNLRSFSHSSEQPYIDVKPITVFVGKNSCGKSSLLRTLPLLRQSFESRTSGPILWYGRYVDYGAFSEAKNNKSECEEIFLDYKFDIRHKPNSKQASARPILRTKSSIELQLGVKEQGKRTVASSLNIKIEGNEIHVKLDDDCTTYLNKNKVETSTKVHYFNPTSGLLPVLYCLSQDFPELDFYDDEDVVDEWNSLEIEYQESGVIFRENILEILRIIEPYSNDRHIWGNLALSEVNLISNLSLNSKKDTLKQLFKIFSVANTPDEETCNQIYSMLLVSYLPKLISDIDDALESYASSITYIAPLRASAERFYRFQDLRVEELDHTGSNLAMLLQSFNARQMRNFQRWSQVNFGFTILLPESNSLHYEIKIEIGEEVHNISDMGFGFSQILPIITSLWFENNGPTNSRKRISNNSSILVIEQPELHLHPELQTLLAKVFISVVHKSITEGRNRRQKIIFETHSKTMIDALGDYIEEHQCPELVNIVIFNKQDGVTNIETASFDEEGDLNNWPIGFFSGR